MEQLLFSLILSAILITIGFTVGSWQEKKHFQSIREREKILQSILLIPSRTPPDIRQRYYRTEFVCGSVVVAMDYFKMVAGQVVSIFGGRIKHYETLVERARREAVLRLKEEARGKQAQMVFNVKFATAAVAKTQRGQPGGSVEVIAYGTAIIYQ